MKFNFLILKLIQYKYLYLFILLNIFIINVYNANVPTLAHRGLLKGTIANVGSKVGRFVWGNFQFILLAGAFSSILNPLYFDKKVENHLRKTIETDSNFEKIKNDINSITNNKEDLKKTIDLLLDNKFIYNYINDNYTSKSVQEVESEIEKEKLKKESKESQKSSIINTKNALIAGVGVGLTAAGIAVERAYQKAKEKNKKLSRIQYLGNSIKSLFNSSVKSTNDIKDRIKSTNVPIFDIETKAIPST